MSRKSHQQKNRGSKSETTKKVVAGRNHFSDERYSNQRVSVEKKKVRKVRRPKVSQHHSYTMLAIFVFLALAIYLVGYIIAFMNRPSIPVETVAYGNIDTPTSLQGIIVRKEHIIKSASEGKISYNYSEYERVKKGSIIGSIRNESTAGVIEDKIEKIDKDILKTQKNRSDLSRFQDDINRIQENISQTVGSFEGKFMDSQFSNVYTMRNQIDVSIGQRNEIWMAENAESLTELSEKKLHYEDQLAKSVHSITADSSGILSFQVDDMVETIIPDKIDSITKEQTRMETEPTYLSKTKSVTVEEPIFKLVTDNQWDIVSYIPNDVAAGWEQGDSKILESTVKEEQKSVSVTISTIDKLDKEAKVVFHSTKGILDFVDERNIEFTVKSSALQGIKIPNNAIIEKTLLKLPFSCITEEDGESGVIKMSGDRGSFVKLTIAKYDEAEGYVYVIQDFNNVKVGEVILENPDDKNSKKQYTISNVHTYQGVYVANSSIAKFTMIDVLGQNVDYAIVKPGSSSYELQAYDTIVSDAKKIEEGQVLY